MTLGKLTLLIASDFQQNHAQEKLSLAYTICDKVIKKFNKMALIAGHMYLQNRNNI